MKKLFPLLAVLVLFSTACDLTGGQAQPTAITVATAFPTNTPITLIPTNGPGGGNQSAGSSRNSPDGMTEVFVPAGPFTMGGPCPRSTQREKPCHKESLDSFCVEKFDHHTATL